MEISKTSELSQGHKLSIFSLWNEEYPDFLVHGCIGDFESYLNTLENAEHYVAISENELIGWLVKFDREGEKWFVVTVSGQMQEKGVGTNLISVVKGSSTELNGWVIDSDSYSKANGDAYRSPLSFYEKSGFDITGDTFENNHFKAVKVKWTSKP
jgi:hypothetical protein